MTLTFSVTIGDFGSTQEVDLIPNGRHTPVTNSTKYKYIHLVSNFKTNVQFLKPTNAFLDGLSAVIPVHLFRMFSPEELQLLISGTTEGFDVDDLRRHAVYSGGYMEGDETLEIFWRVLRSMSHKDRSDFLLFVTSSARAPLLGFKNMYPRFAIHRVNDKDRLPTASTCANLLKLPDYRDEKLLRDKLMQSIKQNSGFQMS
eukprot:GDKI01043319.1.p1 GENE.GDKI01043319.1~~GDKI01043319.1.p1  ORF type:complete len:201 (-),score=59.55 GDKI01043319.1:82-684(-)